MRISLALCLLLLFVTPALAETPRCWVCAPAENGSECSKQNIANLSMTNCEYRCSDHLGGLVCICRSFGVLCAHQFPGDDLVGAIQPSVPGSNPFVSPEVTVDRRITAAVTDAFGIEVGKLLQMPTGEEHLGEVRGLLSYQEPDGGQVVFHSFRGEVERFGDLVSVDYVFEDHPTVQRVTGDIWAQGALAWIEVTHRDGTLRSDTFSAD